MQEQEKYEEDTQKFIDSFTEDANILIEEMSKFQEKTAPEIIKLIEKEDYLVGTAVMGLIAVSKMIIKQVGNDVLLEYAVEALKEDTVDINEIKEH